MAGHDNRGASPSGAAPVRRGRRTQAERSEAMQSRVIDAAIRCLHQRGYSATSTVSVMNEAGVSRGAMLHHYPTKVDLMLAVARAVVQASNAERRRSIISYPRGKARFEAITLAAWETIQQPQAMALIEILMASRSDPDLAGPLAEVVAELDESQMKGVREIAADIGIHDGPALEAMSRLHQAAMRGLAIELLFTDDRAKVDQALQLLTWYKTHITRCLLAGEPIIVDESRPSESV